MNFVQRLGRAAEAFSRRELEHAEHECRALLQERPGDPDTTHLLGLVRRQAGDPVEAERLLRDSIARLPDRAEFRVNLGNLLRSSGRLRDAEQQYRTALQVEPTARAARLALARLLNEAGVSAAAEAEAAQLLRADARDAEAWVALGVAQRAQGRLAEAESSYRRAAELRPRYAAAHHNLGALLGQLKRAEESLAALDRAAALGLSGRELNFNRGRALMELGRLDEADAALAAAVEREPAHIESHVLLAKLRFMRGEPDFARALAASAQRVPGPRLGLVLGDLLRRAGRAVEAEAVLRELVATHGWTPEAAAGLAVVLQEQRRLPEALAEARRSAAARPDDTDIADTLITLLLQLGEPAEARPLVLRQRAREPLDQRWLAHEATVARLLRDPAYERLYDYARFVRPYDLEAPPGYPSAEAFNAELAAHLQSLHGLGFRTHPLDQSLRFGTQTSRSLLADPDPHVRAFLAALEQPIAEYRASIGRDPEHPLLSRNRGESRLAGCWSVRLARGGYHVNHVHPEGWISSAYYVEVPDEVEDAGLRSGWIKFGEPGMPTPGAEPAHFVQPRAGRLVLFPSYMWHGTTPIQGDQPRMTAAFDVVPTGG